MNMIKTKMRIRTVGKSVSIGNDLTGKYQLGRGVTETECVNLEAKEIFKLIIDYDFDH